MGNWDQAQLKLQASQLQEHHLQKQQHKMKSCRCQHRVKNNGNGPLQWKRQVIQNKLKKQIFSETTASNSTEESAVLVPLKSQNEEVESSTVEASSSTAASTQETEAVTAQNAKESEATSLQNEEQWSTTIESTGKIQSKLKNNHILRNDTIKYY